MSFLYLKITWTPPPQHWSTVFSAIRVYLTTWQSYEEPLGPGPRLKGNSGKIYRIEEILPDRRKPLLCVYRTLYGPFNDHQLIWYRC